MSEFRTIRELCSVVADCPHSTPKWTTSGKVVVRNNNIKHGRIDLSLPSYTDEEHFAQRIKRAKPHPGDIIITREAPIGDVGMIPENTECCLGQRMVLLRADQSVCDNFYFNFIGEDHPPAEEISEEERIRKIDEQAEAKNVKKRQKSVQRYRERQNELKAAAQAGDPEAIAKLESERE